jgi:hypothetical protein
MLKQMFGGIALENRMLKDLVEKSSQTEKRAAASYLTNVVF